jgi:hypothetical protein
MKKAQRAADRISKIKLRKHLNADALFSTMRKGFDKISDHRKGNARVSLSDALMSGLAVFSLKDPSLLAFDERRHKSPMNLKTIFGINNIPCDTSMRTILDGVNPSDLRPLFKDAFRQLQRGKALEKMAYMDGCYLLNLDGTSYFSSHVRHNLSCMEKVRRSTGEVTYYLQMLGAAIVHPDHKEVIPLCPEMIMRQDGDNKNDCERNAARRFLAHLRREHPHLPLIVNEDALSSNAPHIHDLEEYGVHYILGVKPKGHKFLFQHVNTAAAAGKVNEFTIVDKNNSDIKHHFRIMNNAPLNESNQDVRVNFIDYKEENIATGKVKCFSWVTDFEITSKNAMKIMRAGRARWKIENETFNTLKNQGYNLGHNYGLGEKNLSVVFVLLMMLAFLVDQIQQLCCPLFNALWKDGKTKRVLWEKIRYWFHGFIYESMEHMYRFILDWVIIDLRE